MPNSGKDCRFWQQVAMWYGYLVDIADYFKY